MSTKYEEELKRALNSFPYIFKELSKVSKKGWVRVTIPKKKIF